MGSGKWVSSMTMEEVNLLSKEILSFYESSDAAYDAEKILIGDLWKTDLLCKNEKPGGNQSFFELSTYKHYCNEKYGVDHPSKLLDFKSKLKHTKLIKYGDENYVNVEKSKITKQNKYGSEKYNNSEKLKQTCV
mgnify:CR=1 FL=1